MSTRRDFLMTSAGVLGAAMPFASRSQALPCPPPQLSAAGAGSTTTSCAPSTMPAFIASMAPFQVRSMSGSFAPSNGTSTLRSVMPSMWGGDDDIMRPWSGGAKSTTGTKMYVHGGGHGDSANNGLYSFDFAGNSSPAGWSVENPGKTGVSGESGLAVGATGIPVSVHTYDGMVDMGPALYRLQGSTYPNGFLAQQNVRFDKASKTWTRLPNYPGGQGGGMAIAHPAGGKILYMERWVTYFTYGFYRVATNTWSAVRNVGSQWPSDGTAAFNPANNTGLCISSDAAFSIGIDWSAETVSQSSRSLTSMGSGVSLVWDPTAGCYWCFGGSGRNTTLYEINPSSFAVTAHTLTGDVPLSPESGSHGHFGRWVFMDEWRAIGSVSSRTSAPFVIRLP